MLEQVIVGYDGEETGDEALALAAGFAHVFGSELHIAHCYDDLVTKASEEAATAVAAHVREVFARAAALLDHDIRSTMAELPGQSPARELLALTEREHADLIVVGSRRLGPVQRITLGSVSNSVLHGAPCAVAIPPRGYVGEARPPRRIAVGWVPTAEADAALRFAHALAAEIGGTLTVVSTIGIYAAVPMVGAAALVYDGFLEDLCRGARRDIEAAVEALDGDVAVTIQTEIGDAADELVRRSADSDLIVLGSRGYGAIRRVVLGGVSFRVLRDAQCPVIVLPRASVEAADDAPVGSAAADAE